MRKPDLTQALPGDVGRARWLAENAGIQITRWTDINLWPVWFSGDDMRRVVDAAMACEEMP